MNKIKLDKNCKNLLIKKLSEFPLNESLSYFSLLNSIPEIEEKIELENFELDKILNYLASKPYAVVGQVMNYVLNYLANKE